jgi:hypothetical protein
VLASQRVLLFTYLCDLGIKQKLKFTACMPHKLGTMLRYGLPQAPYAKAYIKACLCSISLLYAKAYMLCQGVHCAKACKYKPTLKRVFAGMLHVTVK